MRGNRVRGGLHRKCMLQGEEEVEREGKWSSRYRMREKGRWVDGMKAYQLQVIRQ